MTSYVLNKFSVYDPCKMFKMFCLFQVKFDSVFTEWMILCKWVYKKSYWVETCSFVAPRVWETRYSHLHGLYSGLGPRRGSCHWVPALCNKGRALRLRLQPARPRRGIQVWPLLCSFPWCGWRLGGGKTWSKVFTFHFTFTDLLWITQVNL